MNTDIYYKYKSNKARYLALNMKGGVDFISGWKKIPNLGQQNCGIFINNNEPDKIMKCEDGKRDNLTKINSINEQFQLFPKIYKQYYTDVSDKTYTIMQKFDGDLTNYLMHFVPQEILKKPQFKSHAEQIYAIYDFMMPKTSKNTIESSIPPVVENSDVTIELYDKFINELTNELNVILPEINKQIAMIELVLYNLGYEYVDDKFDNFGYILSDNVIEHLAVWKANKFFNKYVYVYVIDWDSGLFERNEYRTIKNILDIYNNKAITYFGVNGQYSINNIGFVNKYYVKLDDLKQNIKQILSKEYKLKLNVPVKHLNSISAVCADLYRTEKFKFNHNPNLVKLFLTICLDNYTIDEISENSYQVHRDNKNKNNLIVKNDDTFELVFLDNNVDTEYIEHTNLLLMLHIIKCGIVSSINMNKNTVDLAVKLLSTANNKYIIEKESEDTYRIRQSGRNYSKKIIIKPDKSELLFIDDNNNVIDTIKHKNVIILLQLIMCEYEGFNEFL